jgi:hypothetical protein
MKSYAFCKSGYECFIFIRKKIKFDLFNLIKNKVIGIQHKSMFKFWLTYGFMILMFIRKLSHAHMLSSISYQISVA